MIHDHLFTVKIEKTMLAVSESATFICCMYFLMLSFSFTKFLSTRSFTYTMYV